MLAIVFLCISAVAAEAPETGVHPSGCWMSKSSTCSFVHMVYPQLMHFPCENDMVSICFNRFHDVSQLVRVSHGIPMLLPAPVERTSDILYLP